jgi:hypothetical protein
MTRTKLAFLPLVFAASALPMFADSIPYSNVGTVANQVTTYATSSGGITGYFVGSSAGYDDQIEVYDVQTGYDSGKLLDNKTSSFGTSVQVGTGAGQINAGDQLVFFIDSPEGRFASIAADSPDNINHAYITSYAGGTYNGELVPAGYFIGMEDEPYGHSDLNYNDEDVYFTGIAAATPEPASLALLGTGLLGGIWLRKRGWV